MAHQLVTAPETSENGSVELRSENVCRPLKRRLFLLKSAVVPLLMMSLPQTDADGNYNLVIRAMLKCYPSPAVS